MVEGVNVMVGVTWGGGYECDGGCDLWWRE